MSQYQWTAVMRALEPGAEYCYRISLATSFSWEGTDPSPTFVSAVGPETFFRFAVLGDWGVVGDDGRNPYQANILRRIA